MQKDYSTIIEAELDTKQVIKIEIKEGSATHINHSNFLGSNSDVDFYAYYK